MRGSVQPELQKPLGQGAANASKDLAPVMQGARGVLMARVRLSENVVLVSLMWTRLPVLAGLTGSESVRVSVVTGALGEPVST